MLERATDIVLEIVKALHHGMNLERIKELNDKLQFLEGEADKHMISLYKDLFGGKHEPVQVIVLKDLYELLEKIIDHNAIKWTVVERMVWAWILTLPVTAGLAYAFVRLLRALS